ncbi:LysR family transcriptional regulator [Roseiarcaceae bacterium H3SJ34-1]|uniref:LysR family transcriptional regulator n=1 Tax=Terripilifer ovatus TaxID=3032367 RepID=UPI003AB98633|nr:LysR family transcriptional regulator [Roseiarcaceae bacterium H3SJ34-1]
MSNDPQFTLRQFRYFMAVARCGGFNAAARSLGISQPALGLQIRNLEDVLGVALFDRSAQGAMTTPAGKALMEEAEFLFARLKLLQDNISTYRDTSAPKLIVGATTTVAHALLPYLMQSCPQPFTISLYEGGESVALMESVRAGTLDAALCYEAPHPDVRQLRLFDEDFMLVGLASRIGHLASIPLACIGDYSLIVGPNDDTKRHTLLQLARSVGATLSIGAEINSITLKIELLRQGHFIVTPYGRYLQEVEAGELAAIPFDPPYTRSMSLMVRKTLGEAATTWLTALIQNGVNERISEGRFRWRHHMSA